MAEAARWHSAVHGGRELVERPRIGSSIELAVVLARDGDRFLVRSGRSERFVECDPSVDPALVEEAIATGARVVLDAVGEPVIVGALATSRPLTIDRRGRVRAEVAQFEVVAQDSALLRTSSAFIRVKNDEVETFGRRVLTRAREVARVLARAIQLN